MRLMHCPSFVDHYIRRRLDSFKTGSFSARSSRSRFPYFLASRTAGSSPKRLWVKGLREQRFVTLHQAKRGKNTGIKKRCTPLAVLATNHPRCCHCNPSHGLMRVTPVALKSATLRVTTVMPCTRAVAAISASRSPRLSGTCSLAQR